MVPRVLWLLRHGDAEDGSPDSERPLTAAGEDQARTAGAALAAMGVSLDACLTSPKVRAAETARLACESLSLEPALEQGLVEGPFDPTELALPHGDDVLLVGPDPDFSMAVHSTTGAQVRMSKGGMAGIDRGELKVLLRPHELRALAAAR